MKKRTKDKPLVPKKILAQLDRSTRALVKRLERSKKPVSGLTINLALGDYTSALSTSTKRLEVLVVQLTAAMKWGMK